MSSQRDIDLVKAKIVAGFGEITDIVKTQLAPLAAHILKQMEHHRHQIDVEVAKLTPPPPTPSTFKHGSGEPEKAVVEPIDNDLAGRDVPDAPHSLKEDVAKLMAKKDEPVKFHGEIDPKPY